jgi:acetylglutamate kinase
LIGQICHDFFRLEGATIEHTMVEEAIRKAEVLTEALGYIRKFRQKTVVIKLGGSVLEYDDMLDSTLQDVLFLETVGLQPILIHGGGKAISSAMKESGIQPRFVQGRRYTDPRTLEIVSDVLTQQISADIVRRIEAMHGWAMPLHHRTTNILYGTKIDAEDNGQRIDLGRVGAVTRMEESRLRKLLHAGVIPVIPSLAIDEDDGGLLNVNADTAASAVAQFLHAEKLVFISDTPGILADEEDESSLLSSLTSRECRERIADGTIRGGMIPKVEACLDCLNAGVGKIHIIDGRVKHSLLLEIYTDSGVGTEIRPR